MPRWTPDELELIDRSPEIDLTTFRRDGTARRSVPVWVVRKGDDLYIRSWRGRQATWFRGAQREPKGSIRTGDRELPVLFVEAGDCSADQLDAAYRDKYRSYGVAYVDPMVGSQARAATMKLIPRVDGEASA